MSTFSKHASTFLVSSSDLNLFLSTGKSAWRRGTPEGEDLPACAEEEEEDVLGLTPLLLLPLLLLLRKEGREKKILPCPMLIFRAACPGWAPTVSLAILPHTTLGRSNKEREN